MTKEYLEEILTEYGVAFTDSLADRLLKEFKSCEDVPGINDGSYNSIKTELKPCDDAISRVETVKFLSNHSNEFEDKKIRMAFQSASSLVNNPHNLPPVQPQPKTGHWIRWYEQKETEWCIENIPHCKCSECGKEYDPYSSQFIKYCNECGAKMQESEEV